MILTIFAVIGAVLFGAGQGITIPILIASFKSALASPYYIVVSSAAWFALIFGFLYIALYKKNSIKLFRHKKEEWSVFCLTGLFDALTGICIVYASDATRTPIVMQTVLAGFTVIFTLIVSKSITNAKKRVKVFNPYVAVSILLLFTSVGISTIPQIHHSEFGFESIFWIGIYLTGTICRAIYNTLQEKYMNDIGTENEAINKATILFWTCAFQFIFSVALIWVDFLPLFGYSHPDNFGSKSLEFVECYFSIDCKYTFLYAMAFVGSYIGSYLCAIQLNSGSASFSMMTNSMIGPSIILFFSLDPAMNPGIDYPIYITIPVVLCSIASTAIWGYWEQTRIPRYSQIN